MAKKDEYKVQRDHWQWKVRGQGSFPLDMLRYDGCYPYQSDDTAKIEKSFREPSREMIEVRLVSRTHGPTIGRWQSFGWFVERF